MTLQTKVLRLKLDAVIALRHASWWEKQILIHGEQKATAFYTHLGLNHLETKSTVEWEGLTLSREPKDHEKLCVKGVSQAQDTGKASVTKILLEARQTLIDAALQAIKKLTPANYHKLILTPPNNSDLRDELSKVFIKGKELVALELAGQKSVLPSDLQIKQTSEDDTELDDLTDLTDGRLANEIQARITSAAARYTLLGLTGKALWDAVEKEVGEGSTGYVDRIATGVANKVLNFGRSREMEARKDEIDRYEQSELLDQNTCPPCAEDDGKTASNPDDLPGAPNPDCEGGDYCRGFIVATAL